MKFEEYANGTYHATNSFWQILTISTDVDATGMGHSPVTPVSNSCVDSASPKVERLRILSSCWLSSKGLSIVLLIVQEMENVVGTVE